MKTHKKIILNSICFFIFASSYCQIEEFPDEKSIKDYKMLHDLSPSTGIPPFPYQTDWDTVFVDNFDDVSSLDNWTPKENPRGHQLCLFQDSVRNISINTTEEKLYITPVKENVIYSLWGGNYQKQYYYTSGELISNAEFRFGYFEIRCKMPTFKGAHPAFWLLSDPQVVGDKVDALELDIFEAASSNIMETRRNSFTVNYMQYINESRDNGLGFFVNNDEPTNSLSDKFYTYALEWTPNELTYYLDNRIIYRVPIDTNNSASIIKNMYPCHIRICTEIDWWNPPNEDTQLEPFIIDYIRVYQKDSYIPKPEINGNEIVTYVWNTYSVENPNPNSTYTWEIDENGELNNINPDSVQARIKSNSTTAVLTLKEELYGNIATNQKIITNRLPTEFRAAVNYWVCNNPSTQLELQHNDQNNLPFDTTNLINKFELFEADILGDKKNDNPIYTSQSNKIDSIFKINDHVIPDSTYVVEHELSSDQYYSKSRRIVYPTLNSAFCPIVWDKNDPKNIWAKGIGRLVNSLWKLYQCNLTGNEDSLIYQVDIPPSPPSVPHLDFCYYLDNQESDYYYLDHTTYMENNDCFPDKTRRMYFYTKDKENIDPDNINCYIPFRKYPYILLKENSVTVMWQLYSNLNCTFYYKKSIDPEFIEIQVNDPYTNYFLYKYELTNLDPDVLYDFKVVVSDTYPCEKTGSFISPPDSTETQISFYGYGDTRGSADGGEPPFHDEVCYKVVDEINNDPTSQTLIIHSGDWNYTDSEEMWDAQYFLKDDDNAVELRTKIGVVGCIGNHEGGNCGTNAPNFRKYWSYDYPDAEPNFWHSFDYGPVHFCFADQRWQHQTLGNPEIQKDWIKNDLKESNKSWKVLVFHPPVYTCTQDPNDYNSEIDFFDEILNDPEKYGVNMVLNGHVHKYSDWLVNGVHHLTLGGGGAPRDEEDVIEDNDPNNPNIVRYQTNWHFAKFEVNNDYIKVKVPYCTDDTSSWDILDEFIIPHSFIIDSGENIVWEDHACHYYADSIRVKTGGVLTIKGDVEFQRDGGIIVEPGGKLIVDNALLTCLGDYNDDESYWQGIQVWGNSSTHQWPDTSGICRQGYLELHNATIENAVTAVDLWRPNYWSKTGGIVYAYNTTFRNNAKSIHALYYKNYLPYDTTQEMNYRGYFKDCTFEIDTNYSGEYKFYKHVDLFDVKGIKFNACNFTLADVEGVSQWSSGIAAYDAGFSVYPVCNSSTQPCSDYDSCYFNGFKHAIFAITNGSTINSFSVNRARFVNNACGVKIMGVHNAIILRSDFEIGFNSNSKEYKACDGYYNSYGIILDNASGFAIEENNFTKYTGAPIGNYIGIIINNTQAADEVYRNTFDGVSYANFAQGKNWFEQFFWEGLAYFCNENTDNYSDFYVSPDPNNPSGIQLNQGDDENVTGNKFSQTDVTWHFYNGGDHRIDYYYCDYCANENPDSTKIYQLNKIDKKFNNSCPSHYGGGSSGSVRELVLSPQQKLQAEQEFALRLSDYNSVKALYDNFIDGGNTNSELSDIQTAQSNDMWALKTQLLGDSPHLSMEVLKAAADKTDVFPESVVFDIMAANPDELKKEELIKFLEDKENPLPVYMIDILRQVANGITYKTVLQQQMSRYNRNKTRAAYDIIRSNLNDSITDFNELRNWLDNIGGIRADEQIIASYIQEGNYTDALSLANMLPALYDMEGDELTEHNYYMDILTLHFNLQQQDRNILNLDSTEVAGLIPIAENSNGTAGVQARNILEYGYDYNYFSCPNINGSASYKNSNFNMEDFIRIYGIEITVKPNPAREWTTFNYQLPDDISKGVIKIIDVYGKLIEIFTITGKQGQKIWDTRNVNSGIYYYNLNTTGFSKSGKLIINK